ncbi:MAG: isopentenyl-diphosphate Delta-isomerase [Gammaproteobacteria bacterium]|jgi:isopentenyl-diphosphate delta-isomerase|nr:isopentenyl-diphosphate Delta-isomerase [Gammaproteobacteria bacterium]
MNDQHRIVSSESEELILVDRADNEVGFVSKADAHDGAGILHRAFSLFLFNDKGELLVQQRAPGKRLWGGYWSNSCCSHPRRGESMQIATSRRLLDELNIEAELEYVYHFCYEAHFGDAGSENELCHVYLGKATEPVQPNDSEIAAIRFVSTVDLDTELADYPERFTPWFKQEWEALQKNYREQLGRYCDQT